MRAKRLIRSIAILCLKRAQRAACFSIVATTLSTAGLAHAQSAVILDSSLGTPISISYFPDLNNPANTIALPIFGEALLTVDNSGRRTLLSDFGNPAQGPIGSGELAAVTWMPSGLLGLGQTIAVLDSEAGASRHGMLFAVDPRTGKRSVLTDFDNSKQGQVGVQPVAMVVANGLLGLGTAIYVVDDDAGTNGDGVVFRVDPATGQRTILTDFGNAKQGPIGVNPVSVAIAPSGLLGLDAELVVVDDDAGTNKVGAVFAIDCHGNRTMLSDLGNSQQGEIEVAPQQIAVVPGLLGLGTAIYVTDNEAGANSHGALFRINPIDGSRVQISNFGNPNQGALGDDPNGITPTATGNLLVADEFAGSDPTQAELYSVNPNSGERSIVVDCSNTALGPCQQPTAVTLVP